jgi:hypothetical protein
MADDPVTQVSTVYGYENVGVALTSSKDATVYGYEETVLPSGFTGWGMPI